jgi:hypothetical protein
MLVVSETTKFQMATPSSTAITSRPIHFREPAGESSGAKVLDGSSTPIVYGDWDMRGKKVE